jgi:hypothetical protein
LFAEPDGATKETESLERRQDEWSCRSWYK